MRILLLLTLFILAISFIGKRFFYSAKRNLFKDQSAWSGKDIIIKHRNPEKMPVQKGIDNYLKIIADESKTYLENESRRDEE